MYVGQAHETGTSGHLTCLLLSKALTILMIVVCMDRAQQGELGTLYFCRYQMYISYLFPTMKTKEHGKK